MTAFPILAAYTVVHGKGDEPLVVYLDSLFLLNLGLDELLLFTAAKLGGVRRRHGRIFLAAVLGALYAVILFCQRQSYAAHPLARAAVAVGMVFLAVGRRQQPWRVRARVR
ncbi:MAG: sigma-E processing peptidase SpoIIGA, partial [Clostridiales bacterium]|nr:sigma-E processing peptidase SpoIIGA [Clostridiales bacterium]